MKLLGGVFLPHLPAELVTEAEHLLENPTFAALAGKILFPLDKPIVS